VSDEALAAKHLGADVVKAHRVCDLDVRANPTGVDVARTGSDVCDTINHGRAVPPDNRSSGVMGGSEDSRTVVDTPRSASSCATSFERIELPRSAWIVSWPGTMPWRSQVSSMSFSASVALSFGASIQPTTQRLNTSMITYR
jgi:hypothetical protein